MCKIAEDPLTPSPSPALGRGELEMLSSQQIFKTVPTRPVLGNSDFHRLNKTWY